MFNLHINTLRSASRKPRLLKAFRPQVEALEDRTVPSTIYQYDPGLATLPEAQGFTRFDNLGTEPAPIVTGGLLHQFPSHPVDGAQYWFRNSASLNFATGSYVLEANLHVISSNYISNIGTGQRSGYYLTAADGAARQFSVGIASTGITINTDSGFATGQGVPFTPFNSANGFHTYRLVIGGGMGSLFIDGSLFASTPLGESLLPYVRNRVLFGDLSGRGVSETDLRSFGFGELESPDLVATSLTWNPAQGGVDFSYQVSGGDLAQDTTAELYWAGPQTYAIASAPFSIDTADKESLGGHGPFHIQASDLTVPPSGTTQLLLVLDPPSPNQPHGVIEESDENNNDLAISYQPAISITAKYDGDPTDAGMGRYFSGTDVLKYNYYTLVLSDSLDALRPAVEVKVGDQTLDATISLTDPHKYVTAPFDPGSLTHEYTPLQGQALIGTTDLANASALIQVEPLPDWANALTNFAVSFDPNGNRPGGSGAYVLDGFLPGLSIGGTVFTIPASVPLIGGQGLQASAGFEIKTLAPLSVSSVPTLEAGLQANLTLGQSVSLPVLILPPTVGFNNGDSTCTVAPGATLDPLTLTQPDGFTLTVAFDTTVAKPLNATLFEASTIIFPFGIPVEMEFAVTAALSVMLHAHAQIAYDSAHGLEFLPGGTYLGIGLEGSVTATGEVGWFAPPWVQRLLPTHAGGIFHLASFALRDTATVAVNAQAEAHLGGPIPAVEATGIQFKGSASFSDKLDLVLEIGDREIVDLIIADLEKPFYSWSLP